MLKIIPSYMKIMPFLTLIKNCGTTLVMRFFFQMPKKATTVPTATQTIPKNLQLPPFTFISVVGSDNA